MTSIGEELGGPQKGLDMLKGRGVAHILKSIEIQFRRPVTYPDTVSIVSKQLNIIELRCILGISWISTKHTLRTRGSDGAVGNGQGVLRAATSICCDCERSTCLVRL